jgi:hypothetical protein
LAEVEASRTTAVARSTVVRLLAPWWPAALLHFRNPLARSAPTFAASSLRFPNLSGTVRSEKHNWVVFFSRPNMRNLLHSGARRLLSSLVPCRALSRVEPCPKCRALSQVWNHSNLI